MAERVRIEIGFDGGQIMGALVDPGAVDRLEQALSRATTGRSSSTSRTAVHVALRRIVYVKRFAREGRVGFGA